jgi:hypothetical protein
VPVPRGGSPGYAAIRNGEIKAGRGHYVCNISAQLNQFINAMIHPDADARPTAAELVQKATAKLCD